MQDATIGRWWGKGQDGTAQEIDLVAYDDATQDALLVECKWQSNVSPAEICQSQTQKASNIKFKGTSQSKNLVFLIFAKTFRKNITTYLGIRVKCIDLTEMETNTTS